jgi:hypothetical protein
VESRVVSDDEMVLAIVSALAAAFLWGLWYASLLPVRGFGRRPAAVRRVALAPLAAMAVLWFVLRNMASFDVQDDLRYLLMYLAVGAAWTGLGVRLLPWFGLDVRRDVAERRNDAAAVAIGGAVLGSALCFAGGNIGDGPGWWVVLIAALMANAGLFWVWGVLERLSNVSEVVTVERDLAAGIRLAGVLIASGLVLGRAVAGDWVSLDATIRDFALTAWPVLLFAAMAVFVERMARPTVEQPSAPVGTWGAAPAILYVALAAIYVLSLPRLT